jgi:periplasmic copper chaperone A
MKNHTHSTLRALVATTTLAAASLASAHVVLEEPVALAGSSYRASFRVGHGCDGSPTTGIRVFVPTGVQGAKPMPKAGWTLTTRRAPLPQPYQSHGKTIVEDVVEISWVASSPEQALPDDWYEEFVLRATLPAQAGPLWFRVLQTCANGQLDWAQVPAQGTTTKGLKAPAALLDVLPSGPAAAHAH